MAIGVATLENLAVKLWKRRSVFVTGATGLLGSWLVEELLGRGASVTCLVRDWVPSSRLAAFELLSRTNVVHGELEDVRLLSRALNEYEVDTVFHLGAQAIVGTASRLPLSTFESNVRGTWNLLEACRNCSRHVARIVVASSDKAYGEHERLPYTEDTPLQGRYPYDASKSCADLIATSYFHTYRLPLTIARCGNIFGGGDMNLNRLVPGTIVTALRGERPVIRSSGQFVRDYFYVRDAVTAYLLLADKLHADKVVGQAFNLGNEAPISVLDLVRRILVLARRASLKPKILDRAIHEIPAQRLDCGKARKVLGFRPRYSLDEGLRETIAWYRNWLRREQSERNTPRRR